MSNVVGEIVIDVTADVGPLVKQMGKAEGAMKGLQGAAGRMGGSLSRAGGIAVTFGKRMAVVAAGVAAVTAGSLAFMRSTAAMGDAIGDAAKAAGMSTTAFQEYRFALMEAAAMSEDEFASAAERLNKTLGEARAGSETAIRAFEAIGVSQEQLAKSTFTTDEAMAAFIANAEATKDPALAAAKATDLFGKAGAGLGAALSGTPGQVKDLVERARELGVVLGPDAVRAAGEFDQKMNDLGKRFEVMKLNLADKLLPAFNDYVIPLIEDYVIPAIEKLGGAFAGAIELIGEIGKIAISAFADFKTAIGGALDWVIGKFDAFMAKLDAIIGKAREVGQAVAGALGMDGSATAATSAGIKTDAQARLQNDMGPAGFYTNRSSPGIGGTMGGQMMGAAIVNGAVLGAVNSLNENRAALQAVFEGITQVARETLGINSPSTVFAEIGGFVSEGLANGIKESQGMVDAAVSQMGSSAVRSTDVMVNDVLSGLDTLLAGSQKAGAALAWVNTLIGASQEIKKGTFGFASMAKVLAQGAALVKGINGAKGGRSSAAAGSGSSAAAAAPAQQQPVQNLGFTFISDPFGIGERVARDMALKVNQAQRNGMRLNVTVG